MSDKYAALVLAAEAVREYWQKSCDGELRIPKGKKWDDGMVFYRLAEVLREIGKKP